MSRVKGRLIWALLAASSLGSQAAAVDFASDVRPILEARCFGCHGPDKQKGKVRLDTLATDFVKQRAAAETWHDAMNVIQLGEMPPDDEPDLSRAERRILVDWIRTNLTQAMAASPDSSGGVVLRRLNKDEYRHTLSDLLGVVGDYGSELPSEPLSKDGFLNNGAALGMSALQLEYYLKSAREALGQVLVEGPQPERQVQAITNSAALRNVLPGDTSNRLGRYHYFGMEIADPPRSGGFLIRVKARAELVDGHVAPFIRVHYGNSIFGAKPLVEVVGEARVTGGEAKVYEFRGRAEAFPVIPMAGEKIQQIIAVNNSLEDGVSPAKPVKQKRKKTTYPEDPGFPKVVIESVEFVINDRTSWPPSEHRDILFAAEDEESPSYVAEVLRRFMRRAWRRPPTRAEIQRYQKHFDRLLAEMDSRVAAFQETLAVVLTSSKFLYLVEPELRGKSRSLSDHELAARLSCFLWSSLPDEQLMKHADRQELRKSKTIRAEVARLLANEKSERFIEQFATQWLDLSGVDRVAVNPEFYPDFDTGLEPEMARETHLFFREILRGNESALRLLDADFTMANAALAKHYGLSGPRSQVFERVALAANRPGGLLAHGAMHLASSNGEDSHPIKRAVWIRERLLHDPPAPPPPNVPSLDPSNPDFAMLPVRRQLEVHREDPACNDCHRGIDPWGIALENFDAVGQWREEIRRPEGKRGKKARFTNVPVDANTTLPGGHAITGIEGLKAFLLKERRDQFVHAFVTKLTTYALGRSLELADQPALEKLTHKFAKDGYRIPSLIADIAASELFSNR